MTTKQPSAERRSFVIVLVGVPARREGTVTPALAYAIAFAKRENAALSLYVFAPPLSKPLPMSVATADAWFGQEKERLETLGSETLHAAGKAISHAGLDFVAERPASPFQPPSERFVQLARLNDVSIMDAADAADSVQRTVIEDALFDSGRPLLLVPRHGGNPSPRRILIAWDGSARSARAVKDALPLLAAAETVVAVTVTGEKDLSRMAPGADLAGYLARHGIDCKLATLAAEQRDVAERLRLVGADEDIEMIVMGAFVHSRFRQAVIGGVTQSLLDHAPAPLFLAH
jgi:nucleotide-binding universal stress UspA family protein